MKNEKNEKKSMSARLFSRRNAQLFQFGIASFNNPIHETFHLMNLQFLYFFGPVLYQIAVIGRYISFMTGTLVSLSV